MLRAWTRWRAQRSKTKTASIDDRRVRPRPGGSVVRARAVLVARSLRRAPGTPRGALTTLSGAYRCPSGAYLCLPERVGGLTLLNYDHCGARRTICARRTDRASRIMQIPASTRPAARDLPTASGADRIAPPLTTASPDTPRDTGTRQTSRRPIPADRTRTAPSPHTVVRWACRALSVPARDR